jgi:hypothetical protein
MFSDILNMYMSENIQYVLSCPDTFMSSETCILSIESFSMSRETCINIILKETFTMSIDNCTMYMEQSASGSHLPCLVTLLPGSRSIGKLCRRTFTMIYLCIVLQAKGPISRLIVHV